MNNKLFAIALAVFLIVGGAYYLGTARTREPVETSTVPTVGPTPTQAADTIIVAPTSDLEDETNTLKTAVKQQIVAEHGPEANTLTIVVSKIVEGKYAQGAANEPDLGGGGMWFAAKAGGNWKLVWDGNGTILCDNLKDYPDFPTSMIPSCFDKTKNDMVTR